MRYQRTRGGVSKISSVSKSTRTAQYGDNWGALSDQAKRLAGRRCADCGAEHTFSNPLHSHHVIPLSKGGPNNLANLRVLCENCHSNYHRDNKFLGKRRR